MTNVLTDISTVYLILNHDFHFLHMPYWFHGLQIPQLMLALYIPKLINKTLFALMYQISDLLLVLA